MPLRLAPLIASLAVATFSLQAAEASSSKDPGITAAAVATLELKDAQRLTNHAQPATYPRRAQLLAELSEAYSAHAEALHTRGDKRASETAARKAVDTAERAIALDERSGEAHLALAVAYGRLTDHVDAKTKMRLATRIRDEAQQALALNPKLDMAHHLLGRWYYGIATLNPALKLAARMIYGKLPDASIEQATQHLKQAIALRPKRIIHHWHLAQIYQAEGKNELARPHWEKVAALPAQEEDDQEAKQAAAKALRK